MEKLTDSFEIKADDKFGILVNGLGSTPLMEQYVFANDVANLLASKNVSVVYKKIGDFMTSIDMAGLSLTLIKLEDHSWEKALKSDVTTPAW